MRCLVVFVSLMASTPFTSACNQANTHNIPQCALSGALSAGDALGILAQCGPDACCWCKNTTFTSSLNDTWKDCSKAEQDRAHQFFIQECGSGGPEHANSTTPSSLDQGNDSTTDTNSVAPTHRPTANVTSPLTPHPTTSTPSSALSTSPSSTSLSSTSSPTARSGAVASTNSHGCTITALAIALLGILSRL